MVGSPLLLLLLFPHLVLLLNPCCRCKTQQPLLTNGAVNLLASPTTAISTIPVAVCLIAAPVAAGRVAAL